MKYGLIIHKDTRNIGDDMQSYAASQFLPRIDYCLTRDDMMDFKSDEGEPVAAIANAWYMWQKWNWPPAKCIIPLFISTHYSVSEWDTKKGESPAEDEFLTGIGSDYMNAYGPIGCRDKHTLAVMQKNNIEAYFSGCLTLTLPKQPKIEVAKEYVCLVDLSEEVEEIVRKKLASTSYAIKTFTHIRDKREPDLPWAEKQRQLEERLSIYQNAKYVVTARLHCALPCLAMEVPVFMISHKTNGIRINTFLEFLHYATDADFIAGQGYQYDFVNPPANKGTHIPYREALIERATKFIAEMEKATSNKFEDFIKTTYTDLEFYKWHSKMEQAVLNKWRVVSKAQVQENKKLLKQIEKMKNETKITAKAKRFLKKAKRKVLG